MITTTLNKIRAHKPCENGWKKLLEHLGKTKADDEPLPLLTILESNGVEDTIWCFRTLPEHNSKWQHFAVDCAERVKHLMKGPRSLEALRVARLHADGLATDKEVFQAYKAATAAYAATADAADAAAVYAAYAATTADAAYAAATAAYADADANAAYAAASGSATADAAYAAERKWQANKLKEYIS